MRRTHSKSGFSLIEMVVVVAIMMVIAGAAVPITTKVLTYKARQATKTEIQYLSGASAEFFKDTRRLPTDIAELLVDPGDAGWSGPYMPGVVTDQITGLTGYQVDAWSRAYSVGATGDVLTITSSGEDATTGTETDIAIDLDVTYLRREGTLAQLETINRAVSQYNDQFLSSAPLSTSWSTAVNTLVTSGFLPTSDGYSEDWWGAEFVADPPGVNPVVRIKSPTLDPSGGTSGSGTTGSKGKGKGKQKKAKKAKKNKTKKNKKKK